MLFRLRAIGGNLLRAAVFGCVALLSLEPAAFAVPSDGWLGVAKGLSYKKITLGNGDGIVELHALKVNLRDIALRPILADQRVTVRKLQETTHALAVINANFFDRDGNVLGAVVADGRELHAKKSISWWSVFCINRQGKAEIVPSAQYYKGLCQQAVQSGPRLAVNGVMTPIKDELSRKSAIGINRQGQVVIVASAQAVAIRKLAQIMLKSESEGGLDCPNALNFDGGSSSQLYVNAPSFKLTLPGFSAVPVGLGIFAR